jgi:alpha-D-ribose 1-methylphosphonate 5-triphosphate synthase subunit PhnI
MPEFVLYHSDNVEASGFVQHLKLPHYVDFQSELNLIRALHRRADPAKEEDGAAPIPTPRAA